MFSWADFKGNGRKSRVRKFCILAQKKEEEIGFEFVYCGYTCIPEIPGRYVAKSNLNTALI